MLSKEDYAEFVSKLKQRTEAMMKSDRRLARLSLQTERMLWLDPKSTSLVRAHPDIRQDMLRAHREVELELFGEITELRGEQELRKESPVKDERQIQVSIIAAPILECAINSAQSIEEAFFAEASDRKRFRDEDFQDVVVEFANLFIHLFLRDAFENFGPERGGALSNTVATTVYRLGAKGPMNAEHRIAAFTRKIEFGITVEGWGWDELQKRQAEYGRLPLYGDKDKALDGTLFWDFGRHVVRVCDRYRSDPRIQIQANLLATNAYTQFVPIFRGFRISGRAQ